MTTEIKETFHRVVLSWDDNGAPSGASGSRLIRTFRDGKLLSSVKTSPENILKQNYPLQEFLTEAQETAIIKALELAQERDELQEKIEALDDELSTAKTRIAQLEALQSNDINLDVQL